MSFFGNHIGALQQFPVSQGVGGRKLFQQPVKRNRGCDRSHDPILLPGQESAVRVRGYRRAKTCRSKATSSTKTPRQAAHGTGSTPKSAGWYAKNEMEIIIKGQRNRRQVERENEGEHVRQVEVSLVHFRQIEGYDDC